MKILVSDKLSDDGIDLLRRKGVQFDVKIGLAEDELCTAIKGYEGLLIRSGTKVTKKVLEASDALKVVGRAGVGVDNVDLEAASANGVLVMNTPDGNTITTAELTLAMLLALARHIPFAHNHVREGKWDKALFKGMELAGKTIGIIGLGRIGRTVAKRCQGFELKCIGYDPFVTSEQAKEAGIEKVELNELYAKADIITLHVAKTPETSGMINKEAFSKMKDGVLFLNCARGGLSREKDLLTALDSGKVAGAALDVYEQEPPSADNPLLSHPRVISTCHIGASTREAQDKVSIMVIEQVTDFLEKGKVVNGVNEL